MRFVTMLLSSRISSSGPWSLIQVFGHIIGQQLYFGRSLKSVAESAGPCAGLPVCLCQ